MKVVTICGSMKFEEQMKSIAFNLESRDNMCVLQCIYGLNKESLGANEIDLLNKTHLKKIDISDAIYVVDIDGYIGNQVKKEIEYAEAAGKEVTCEGRDKDENDAIIQKYIDEWREDLLKN